MRATVETECFPSGATMMTLPRLSRVDLSPGGVKMRKFMNKIYYWVFLLIGMAGSCADHSSPKMFEKPLSPRIANYSMDCRFDPRQNLITATAVLEWRNTASIPAKTLQFHLYMNAFRDEKSTYMIELGEVDAALRDHWGDCRIQKIALADGRNLADQLRFIQPDDGNANDRTVVSLALPEAIPPGETIRLNIDFETKLPALTERAGFWRDYFLISQWFPKIGVFSDAGWNCHQYHANSEFFADFGVYDVAVTLPKAMIVGATGVLIDEKALPGGMKKLHFYAEDVHDFAWSADAHFVEINEQVDDLHIRLLLMPVHRDLGERILDAAVSAWRYYNSAFGKYPYPAITIVDTPVENAVMEYPMLFFTGNFDGIHYGAPRPQIVPESNRFPERLTMHEFAHQWWFGMAASNEFEEAWLDESFADYATAKAFEAAYGQVLMTTSEGDTLRVRDFRKTRYTQNPQAGIIAAPAWAHADFADYYIASYVKPKLMLYTLNNYFGEKRWLNVMKTYFQRWKFKHPTAADFIAVMDEAAGDSLNPFLKQYLNTTDFLDYQIESVASNRVTIGNAGKLNFPVEIAFRFADGQTILKRWNARAGTINYDFPGLPQLLSVEIDPRRKIEFEVRTDNNTWQRS